MRDGEYIVRVEETGIHRERDKRIEGGIQRNRENKKEERTEEIQSEKGRERKEYRERDIYSGGICTQREVGRFFLFNDTLNTFYLLLLLCYWTYGKEPFGL